MTHRTNDPQETLDRIVDAIRNDVPSPAAIERAQQRVWSKLAAPAGATHIDPASIDTIRGCADVQALIPAFAAGELSAARAILVQDHTRECVPCRRALRDVRSGGSLHPQPLADRDAGRRAGSGAWRWAVAAALLLTAAFGGYTAYRLLPADPALAAVKVQTIDGSLFRVAGNWSSSATEGEEIAGGQVFRTAKGSHAVVQLADGSLVEMNERSELSVSARRFGTTLHLGRGSVIVEAAKQGARRLFVDTGDCRVAVTGTIFSVNHGTKGSRVSVIEGEVRVRQSGTERVLHPGDQVSTHPSLSTVPVASEIAWSRHLDSHLAILAELTQLRRDIANLPRPAALRDKRLLDLVPPGTTMFAALPNISGNLVEAHRMLHERLESSPALREWWQQTMGGSGGEAALERTMQQLREFGSHFGDELVVAVQLGADEDFEGVTVLAELSQPAAFRPFLEAKLREENGGELPSDVRILDDPAKFASDGAHDLLLYLEGDLFVASNSLDRLRQIQATEAGKVANPFAASAFHAKLAAAYEAGDAWLLGVDLERVLRAAASNPDGPDPSLLQQSGLLDARHLIVEGSEQDGQSQYRAVLTFNGPRHGIAAWLAEPAPMGALEFVSPDASLAAAFVARNPLALTQDLFGMLDSSSPELRDRLAAFEREHGVQVTRDFAAPLGGEFAFALDGPVLPTPSWKFIVEVYDPPRLQQSLAWLVGELNRAHGDSQGLNLQLVEDESGGRVWYALRSDHLPAEVHYTFVDGYLVAGPSRVLVEDAIVRRTSGLSLPSSPQFTRLLPSDGNANFSAVAYQNLASVLGPLARVTGGAQPGAASGGAAQSRLMSLLHGGLEPTLVYAYGEQDRIVAASTRSGGIFGSDLELLLGLQSLFGNAGRFGQAALEQDARTQEGAVVAP